MAIIGRIRKRVGLLIGFVGISLVLFVLGDLVTSNSGLMASNSDVIAVVGGEKVRYQEFEKKVENVIENYKASSQKEDIDQSTTDMLREQAWSMTINDLTLGKEYEKLGITCSDAELYDMCTGRNVHPQIMQVFTDKKTGQFNPQNVVGFLKDLPNRDEKTQKQWRVFEDALRQERLTEKYNNVIKSGIYVTTAEAKQNYTESNRMASIKYVGLDFNSIVDNTVKLEDGDLKTYYKEHEKNFRQDHTARKVEYVIFDVQPSDEDKAAVTEWIDKKKEEFIASTDDTLFVNQNSDVAFDSTLKAKGILPPVLDTVIFDAAIGTIIGPYLEKESYKVAKLMATKMIADSVKARHILIKIQNNDTASAYRKADSLKYMTKNGQMFEVLASQFSEDQGSAMKGGDLGWFKPGMMVPEFNDACFNGNKGDMPIVISQFGVHLIEILDKGATSKQVVVGIVERKMEPSQKTFDALYQQAQNFAANNQTPERFDSTVIKQGLNKRIADNLREADRFVSGLEQPRELIRWAYKVKKGEISKVFTFGNKYVVAKLTEIKEKGILPMEDVMDQVRAGAMKDKKAQMLTEQINTKAQGATTIEAVAQKLGKVVTPADNISFTNSYIPAIGNEPGLIGTIFAMKAGKLSKPVKGESSVYIFSITNFTEPQPAKDFSSNQMQLIQSRMQRAESEAAAALKEKANIEDNRGLFY